jgi:hypothetical protein
MKRDINEIAVDAVSRWLATDEGQSLAASRVNLGGASLRARLQAAYLAGFCAACDLRAKIKNEHRAAE